MSNPIKIFVFNSGHGDHILINFPNNTYGVIDSHWDSDINIPDKEPPGLTYLKKLKEPIHLAFLHLTHYHRDHYKGIDLWIDWIEKYNIPLDHLWMPGWTSKDHLKKSLKEWFDKEDFVEEFKDQKEGAPNMNEVKELVIEYTPGGPLYRLEDLAERRIKQGLSVNYLDGQSLIGEITSPNIEATHVFCLGPSKIRTRKFAHLSFKNIVESILVEESKPKKPSQNYISTLLFIKYGNINLLFGGDAEKDLIDETIKDFYALKSRRELWKTDLKFDFIKVFHHGSHGSSRIDLWKKLMKDDQAVFLAIPAGENSYGHPSPTTVDHIHTAAKDKNCKPNIYCTHKVDDMQLNEVVDAISIAWGIENQKEKNVKEEKKAKIRAANPSPKDQRDQASANNFIGYQFDCSPNLNNIKVKKLVPR